MNDPSPAPADLLRALRQRLELEARAGADILPLREIRAARRLAGQEPPAPPPGPAPPPAAPLVRPPEPRRAPPPTAPPLRPADDPRVVALAELARKAAVCSACGLHQGRTQAVFGVGDPYARLMFVGEGPGATEDRLGEPFVGPAGKLLTQCIEELGVSRGAVYIANVVKCRPPDNRTPELQEIAACAPFLREQLNIVRPRLVCALGKPAAQALLGQPVAISKCRGILRPCGEIMILPTFHPAFILRKMQFLPLFKADLALAIGFVEKITALDESADA